MKNLRKSLMTMAGGMTLIFCASCQSIPSDEDGDGGVPESPVPGGELASLDPCSILPQELQRELGFKGPGEPVGSVAEEPGCDYFGEQLDVAVYKNQHQTVDSYGKNPNWATYKPVSVADRRAAQAIDKGAESSRTCHTLFDAGGGVIMVTANEVRPGDVDECAESLKIAEYIAPQMPR